MKKLRERLAQDNRVSLRAPEGNQKYLVLVSAVLQKLNFSCERINFLYFPQELISVLLPTEWQNQAQLFSLVTSQLLKAQRDTDPSSFHTYAVV